MAFNTNPGRQSFTATASQTDFSFNFKIYTVSDIEVYLTPVGQSSDETLDILAYGSDYTVAIDGDNGGTVTLLTGATASDIIVLNRNLPKTRTTSYVTQGDLKAATINLDQNYQTYLTIDAVDRATRLPINTVGVSNILPVPIASAFLKWSGDGLSIESNTDLQDSLETAWEATAIKMTADSYATEPEDVAVKIWTSDGDGTYTSTDTDPIEYSALHHAAKASASAASNDPTKLLHTVGNGGGNPEGFTLSEINTSFKRSFVTLLEVSSWSYATTTITLNVESGHGIIATDTIWLDGLVATTNAPNGEWTVDSVNATTIVFTATLTPTGTETVSNAIVYKTNYVDADVVGGATNPTAKIYHDGTIIGQTDNYGSYKKYPNGDIEYTFPYSIPTSTAIGSYEVAITFPVLAVGTDIEQTNTIGANTAVTLYNRVAGVGVLRVVDVTTSASKAFYSIIGATTTSSMDGVYTAKRRYR